MRQKPPTQKNKQRKAHRSAIPLDALALQTLRLFVGTLIRCGYSADDIAQQCKVFGQQYEPQSPPAHDDEGVSRDAWVQILTLWSLDPDYVDAEGQPLALRIRGAAPSIESLLERVDSKLSLEEVCDQLLSTGAARKDEDLLVAIAHAPIVFPPGSAEQSAHHLHLLHSVLHNIEHNAAPADGALWVERQSICHEFPQSALAAYSRATSERAQKFLESEDATMHRIASFTPSKDRAVRATVHVIFSARDMRTSEGPSIAASKGSTRAVRVSPSRAPRSHARRKRRS